MLDGWAKIADRSAAGSCGGARGRSAGSAPTRSPSQAGPLVLPPPRAIALEWFWVGLALFLLNRMGDGLDGAIARVERDRRHSADISTSVLDFAVYGAVPLGVHPGRPGRQRAGRARCWSSHSTSTAPVSWHFRPLLRGWAWKRGFAGRNPSTSRPGSPGNGNDPVLHPLLPLPAVVCPPGARFRRHVFLDGILARARGPTAESMKGCSDKEKARCREEVAAGWISNTAREEVHASG